jgi:ketosteroid isomerase-like protein
LPYTAIERGGFELPSHRKSSPAAETTAKGKYITVWQQQADGSWKIVRDISNSDNPPAR